MRPVTENARYGATRNPWNPGALGRWLVGRERVRSRLGDGRARRRQRPRRVDPHPRVVLRPGRPEAQPRPRLDRPRPRRRRRRACPPTACSPAPCIDTAVALDAIAGVRAGRPPPRPGSADSFADAARVAARLGSGCACAWSAPFGMPVDAEPAAAARAAADALEALGHDVGEWTPAWDDESFASSWATFMTGTGQHLVRVIERLHGQPVDPAQLEPATRAWLARRPADAAGRLPRGRRAPVGVRAADAGRVGARRGPAHADAHPAPRARRRDQVAGRRHRRRRAGSARSCGSGTSPGSRRSASRCRRPTTGVPVGVQLVGAHGRDDLLLSVAAQLEAAVGWKPAGRRRPL